MKPINKHIRITTYIMEQLFRYLYIDLFHIGETDIHVGILPLTRHIVISATLIYIS